MMKKLSFLLALVMMLGIFANVSAFPAFANIEKTAATVGSQKFSTLEAAISYAAENGGIVMLQDNVSILSGDGIDLVAEGSKPTQDFAINGNGFTITATISSARRAALCAFGNEVLLKSVNLVVYTAHSDAWGAISSNHRGGHVILDGCTIQTVGREGSCAIAMNTQGKITMRNCTVLSTLPVFLDFNNDASLLPEGNNRILAPSLGMPITTNLSPIALNPSISPDTSVRLRKDSNGIRFSAQASAELVADLDLLKELGFILDYKFGTLICKVEDLADIDFTAEALTAAGKPFADSPAKYGLKVDEESGAVTFTTALVNLKTENYDVPFTATSYVEYTQATGEMARAYATGEKPVQSVKEMALAALAQVSPTKTRDFPNQVFSYYAKEGDTYVKKEGTAYSCYAKAQQTVFQNYLDGVLNHDPAFMRPLNTTTVSVAPHMEDIFRTVGRTYQRGNGALACDLTCTGIRFNVFCEGDVSVKLSVDGQTGYFTVYVDGVRREERLRAYAGATTLTVATDLQRGEHEIMLVKQGQFVMNKVDLHEVTVVGDFLPIPAEKELFFEFYGDSILNGSNVLFEPGKGTSPETSDGTSAFGWLTAERFNADCNIIGCGGLGLVKSGNPNYYAGMLYDLSSHPDIANPVKYDFARIPDAVIIELGVNDEARGSDPALYKQRARMLIENLRKKYGEDVPIIWLDGYHDANFWEHTKAVIDELGGEEANIYVCKTAQTYIPTSEGGDGWHPDEEGSLLMAKKLCRTISDVLKEKESE